MSFDIIFCPLNSFLVELNLSFRRPRSRYYPVNRSSDSNASPSSCASPSKFKLLLKFALLVCPCSVLKSELPHQDDAGLDHHRSYLKNVLAPNFLALLKIHDHSVCFRKEKKECQFYFVSLHQQIWKKLAVLLDSWTCYHWRSNLVGDAGSK